jgi:hypothetical protein
MTTDPDRLNENIHDGVSFVGLRALGDVDKETGRVTNMQLLGVSVVASPTEEYARVPAMSPRRGKSFTSLDQMAFLPPIDMKNPTILGLDSSEGKDSAYCVLMNADGRITEIKSQFGISKELLNGKETYSSAAEHLKHIYGQPERFVYAPRRTGKASSLSMLRASLFPALFAELPLGTETRSFKKREFEYELIGGM